MWVWGFGNHKWDKSLVKSRVEDEWLDKRLLYHAWFPKPHTHISALTALALLKITNERYETSNETRYLPERNESDEIFGQCTHMCQVKVNVLTCDYIDFYKLMISKVKKTCETDAGQKSMYSHVTTLTFVWHMWLHWPHLQFTWQIVPQQNHL